MSHISHISLSSNDRTSDSISESNFRYRLPNSISDVKSVVIDKICIPVSWYVVMTGINDTIVLTDVSDTYTATLSPGVYSASQLASHAQTQIRSAFTTDNAHTVSLDATTYKFTIANTSTNFSLDWSDSTAQKLFGWTDSDVASGASHTAPNIYNLSYSNKIYIISNILATRVNILGNNYRKTLFSSVINESFGELITFDNQGQNWTHFYGNSKDLYELDFKLVFEDGTLIPLNGVDWSITMRFFATLKA